ncbi:MAG: right-handed parallel beta-helix repeat-containing protein [Saprospiraceae bacterium]|nr:right-handed parallel beta-helix repeat-containing protein [Saprospiraceae bacterium]
MGLSSQGTVVVDNCTFFQNSAVDGAGGLTLYTANEPNDIKFTVKQCKFIENETMHFGGAMVIVTLTPASLTIEDCLYQGNKAEVSGGAVEIFTGKAEVGSAFRNCIMQGNESPLGAAISSYPFDSDFGAGSTDASFTFENCLIAENSGAGGTVYLKETGSFNFLNCTIANNEADGLVMDTPSIASIQNTILHNPGNTEYTPLTDNITFNSHGGNLIADASLAGLLTMGDKQGLDPFFVGGGDYHLTEGSPAWTLATPMA